ncbi:MAG: class I SAM-dependent methyltransferase family protein [Candidatus Altiarchaeota archaeon]|nr:class I SAM-dependent methyltransferase family protein [Candidatus Altiarchaeota archaeon]
MHLRVRREQGEEIRRKLIELDFFDYNRRILSEGGFLLIPVTGVVELEDSELVDVVGEKVARRTRSLRESLEGRLNPDGLGLLPRAFDVIGDIAVLELPDELLDKKDVVCEALLETFKNIKVVAVKKTRVGTEFRTRSLEIAAGENRLETIHKEHGCLYRLNIESAYFSPRLGSERLRVASQVKDGERVLVMFAGVGPYPILIAKRSNPREVVAVELNPSAFDYMRENIALNNVDVTPILGDARNETQKLGKFDRIVMPLPKDAGSFLDTALPALNRNGVIHFYDFSSGEQESSRGVEEICGNLGYRIRVLDAVKCGSYSPELYRVCIDFRVV